MIELKELTAHSSADRVQRAREAMDLESVSGFHYERRGRIEGGVKPAPPSKEKPAFARITRRGKRFLTHCSIHGKNAWCIHNLILALHHLGQKPIYQVRRPKPATPEKPRIGMRLLVEFTPQQAIFRVRSLSTNQPVVNPLRFLTAEARSFQIDNSALQLMADLAETDLDHFGIARVDMAPLLSALERTPLFANLDEEHPYRRIHAHGPAPRARVRVTTDRISWQVEPSPGAEPIFIPGWPGYLVCGKQITRFPGYVPDLQFLGSADRGELPLTAENLRRLLAEKHGVTWLMRKPQQVSNPDLGLRLEPHRKGLRGQIGFFHHNRFLPIGDADHSPQWVENQGEMVVVHLDSFRRAQLSRDRQMVKAPWRGNAFHLRENQARNFLEAAGFPEHWRVQRAAADRWFGLEFLEMECTWPGDGQAPIYHVGGESFDHDTLLRALDEQGRLARLPNGQLLRIDGAEILKNEKILRGVESLHQDPGARSRLLERILGMESGADEGLPDPPAIPPRWSKLLRGYQGEGVRWLLQNHIAGEPSLLADDMGLGKTIQTLAYLDLVKQEQPQLIVAPTSLLHNWKEECARFCPHRQVTLHHGPSRATTPEAIAEQDLVISSYGTVLRDIELLYDVAFQVVALDEAQAVKNAASRTAVAVSELWSEHRLALTGTPVENRLTELWALFQFLAPGYLGDKEDIKSIGLPGSAAFQAVRAKAAPFLKRRLKSEVEKDLPEKQEVIVRLPLAEEQASLYQNVLRDSRKNLARDRGRTISILTKLLRLRQVCCHPGLVGERYLTLPSNKLDFLLESLEEALHGGHAVLIFSQFTKLLKLLRFQLEERDWEYLYLDGATRDRQGLVERFQSDGPPLFLISLKAGGTGLNLTRASYVYHLDPWWNPMVEAQATDRAHRIGQTQKVISYKLISEGTVEEKILKLQSGKKFLAEGLWQDPQKLIASMDQETLLYLFS